MERSTAPGDDPQTEPPARGRPRDPRIDDRVLMAARDLLAEEGFAATTVQAIARRSGVQSSAIYRRWGSRIEIIENAVFPGLPDVEVRATGDLRRDLRAFVRAYLAVLSAPAARAAMPGLLASYQDGEGSRPAEEWLRISARRQFYEILRSAAAGEVDPTLDPDDAFDALLGIVLVRTFVPTVAGRRRGVEQLVDVLVRLIRPRG